MSATSTSSSKRIDHRFYFWAAVVATLVVFAGFARTFYLKGLFDTPTLSQLLMAHGVIMTLWFALFIVQIRLVAANRTDLHRRLGAVGAALVVLILAVGVATAIDAGRRGASPEPSVSPLVFMAVPLVQVVVFAVLVGIAIWYRRRSDIHKRLMLLATVSIVSPAIARLPFGFIQRAGLPAIIGLTLLGAILCVIVDTVRNRRLHPAFGWGAAFVIVSWPLRLLLAGTEAWTQFAAWLVA